MTRIATLSDQTQAAIEADIDALNAHCASVQEPHRAAFREPAVLFYATGDTVWLWDDYSTATVVGQAGNGNWLVRSMDCDGNNATLSYPASQLRPAAKPHVFIWPSKR